MKQDEYCYKLAIRAAVQFKLDIFNDQLGYFIRI